MRKNNRFKLKNFNTKLENLSKKINFWKKKTLIQGNKYKNYHNKILNIESCKTVIIQII